MLSKVASTSIVWVFGMTLAEIEPWFSGTLANTLQAISLKNRVFTNGIGDQGWIPGQDIPKTQKMVLDAILLNPKHYKVRIKGKVEQPREWCSALLYTSVYQLLKRLFLGHSWLRWPTLSKLSNIAVVYV